MKQIFLIPLLLLLALTQTKGQDRTEEDITTDEVYIHTDKNKTVIKVNNVSSIIESLANLPLLKGVNIDNIVMALDTPPNDSSKYQSIEITAIESDSGDMVEIIIKDANGKVKKKIRVSEDFLEDYEDLFESFEDLGNNHHIIFKSNGIKIKRSYKKRNVETDWFAVDIGFNGFLHEGSPSLPSSLSNLELDPLRSLHVNVGIFQQKINLYKHRVGFVYGINYDNNDYRFSNNIDFRVNDAGDSISYLSRQSEGFDRNKLTTRFLTVPVALRFDFNPNKRRGGHITIGAHAGYRLTSFFKTVRFDEGKRKTKLRDDFLLNNTRVGAYVKVGYRGFNVFANYVFTPMFRSNTAPVFNTFSFGLAFGGF